MKSKKFIACATMFLILLISSVQALTEYKTVGADKNFYIDDSPVFWSASTYDGELPLSVRVDDIRQQPYVADLDGDGVNEIIIVAGQGISVYNYSKKEQVFEFKNSTYLYPLSDFYSNIEIYDIDGDGTLEIIYATDDTKDSTINILNFSNNIFSNESSFRYAKNKVGMIPVIKCGGEYCGIESSSNIPKQHFFAYFDEATVISNYTQSFGAGVFLPVVPEITYSEYYNQYIMSFIVSGATETLFIDYYAYNGSHAVLDHQIAETDYEETGSYQYSFSSPLVYNFKDDYAGLETVIALNTDSSNTEFNIYFYDENGVKQDSFPTAAQVDGYIISNPVLANVFEGSNTHDFCVMGYTDSGQLFGKRKLSFLCGSKKSTETLETKVFVADGDDYELFNMSTDGAFPDFYSPLIHSIQINSRNTAFSEFLSTYGQAYTSDSFTFPPYERTLILNYKNPEWTDTAFIVVDYDKDGFGDMIGVTNDTLLFFDDGNENQPVTFTGVRWNPCIERGSIKTNQSFKLTYNLSDVDANDNISVRIKIYDGLDNEQVQGWINYTENSVTNAYFYFAQGFNKTVTNGQITLEAYDSGTLQVVTADDIPRFTVADSGEYEYGECKGGVDYEIPFTGECTTTSDCVSVYGSGYYCTESGECEIVPPDCTKDSDCPENYFCNSSKKCYPLQEKGEGTVPHLARMGAGFTNTSPTTFILIVIVVVVLAVMFIPEEQASTKLKGGVILFLVILIIGIGVYELILDFAWLLIFILIGVIIGAVLLGRMFAIRGGQ